nr:contractile peptide [Mytilus edulis]
GPFGTHIK